MSTTLEIIRLRSVSCSPLHIHQALRDTLAATGAEPEVRLYAHLRIEGDLSLHLLHTSADRAEQHAHVGLRLAEALKVYGVVEHSVWTEVSS